MWCICTVTTYLESMLLLDFLSCHAGRCIEPYDWMQCIGHKFHNLLYDRHADNFQTSKHECQDIHYHANTVVALVLKKKHALNI